MALENYVVEPAKELTQELIDRMIIHPTLSHLRRASAVSPCMYKFEATEELPTLYYIKGVKDPEVDDWTVHALLVDVNKFLLMGYVNGSSDVDPDQPVDPEDPDQKPEVASNISWDPGKVGGDLEVIYDGKGMLTYDGEIKYYEEDPTLNRAAGNRIGAVIVPGEGMLAAYPNVKVIINGTQEFGAEVFEEYKSLGYTPMPALYYYPLVSQPGETFTVQIIWSDKFEERFALAVTQESTLESNADVVASESELVEAIAKGGNVRLDQDIELQSALIFNSTQSVIDLNGKKIEAGVVGEGADSDSTAIQVEGGKVVLEGEGEVIAKEANYSNAVYAKSGQVDIMGGTYINAGDNCDLIYAAGDAKINIYGGIFKATKNNGAAGTGNEYTALNIKDKDRETAKITVYGGKFYGFNPADNVSEGAGTNFVAEGYESIESEEDGMKVYTVQKIA